MLTSWVSTFYQALMKTPGAPVAQYFTEICPRYIILFVTMLQTRQSMALVLLLASHPGPVRTSSYGAGAVFVIRNTNYGRWSCICVTSTWDRFIAMATQKRNQRIVPKEACENVVTEAHLRWTLTNTRAFAEWRVAHWHSWSTGHMRKGLEASKLHCAFGKRYPTKGALMHMVHDQEQWEIDQQGPEKANGDQLQVTSWLVFSGSALLGHSLKGPGFFSR